MQKRTIILLILLSGFGIGMMATVGFNYTIHATSTEEFCISCHEMQAFPYQESLSRPHKKNHAGVQAICTDCHLPREFIPKMQRKTMAVREIWHHVLGSMDTPEKFEANRKRLAERVWREMEANDSKACRYCHNLEAMDFASQSTAAASTHPRVQQSGMTCINCHKGVAHALPQE